MLAISEVGCRVKAAAGPEAMYRVLALNRPLRRSLQCICPLPLPAVPFCIPHSGGGWSGEQLEMPWNAACTAVPLFTFRRSPRGDGAFKSCFPGDPGWGGTDGGAAGDGKGTLSFFPAAGHF